MERLRYNKVNNQVSFHTEKALQYVKLVRGFLMPEKIYSFLMERYYDEYMYTD